MFSGNFFYFFIPPLGPWAPDFYTDFFCASAARPPERAQKNMGEKNPGPTGYLMAASYGEFLWRIRVEDIGALPLGPQNAIKTNGKSPKSQKTQGKTQFLVPLLSIVHAACYSLDSQQR